jgi:hypothetical protein
MAVKAEELEEAIRVFPVLLRTNMQAVSELADKHGTLLVIVCLGIVLCTYAVHRGLRVAREYRDRNGRLRNAAEK